MDGLDVQTTNGDWITVTPLQSSANPTPTLDIVCLPTCQSGRTPSQYTPVKSGDYLFSRSRAKQQTLGIMENASKTELITKTAVTKNHFSNHSLIMALAGSVGE